MNGDTPQGWSINSPLNNMSWAQDSSQKYSGNYSMKLNINSGASGTGPQLYFTASNIQSNSYYVVSFWYRSENFNGSYFQFVLHSLNLADNDNLMQSQIKESNSSVWKRGYVMVKTLDTNNLRLYIRAQGVISGPGTIWIDNIQLRRLNGSLLNVIRQPLFPEDDIVVTNTTKDVTKK